MNYPRTEVVRHVLMAVPLYFILCLCFTNCTSDRPSSDVNEIKEALRKSDASIQNAISQKNIDPLLSFYAEDAFLLPTAEPMVKGKAAIKREWQHIFTIPRFTSASTLTTVDVSKDGSMAYTMGTYLATMQGEDGTSVEEPGKWVTIWKKQPDGRWLIVVETYNTDIPPPDHK